VENIDILVNGQKVFQGGATFISRDIQFLGYHEERYGSAPEERRESGRRGGP
jgi:hypothetical protein